MKLELKKDKLFFDSDKVERKDLILKNMIMPSVAATSLFVN
jgi:hypothetical protein